MHTSRSHHDRLPRHVRPRVEFLEDRCVLAGNVDVILEWNAVTLEANRVDHTPALGGQYEQRGPGRTARAFAIVHAAMYDAYNAVDRSGQPFKVSVPGTMARGADADAAAAAAAFRTLTALYPSQWRTFSRALMQTLDRTRDGLPEAKGVALGLYVGSRYLHLRTNDGSQLTDPYVPHDTTAGYFQTFAGEPAALDPNWGSVTPFGMLSADQFRAAAPPTLDSQAYADAYHEVWTKGAADAETADRDGNGVPDRTAEETLIGIYWGYDGTAGLGTPPRLYNQIARTIGRQERNTEAENARMFALINVAMADAGIASWETKYTYDIWRPNRGIQQVGPNGEALDDGNPLTQAEAGWTALGAPAPFPGADFTPPFPAYTSGHATFGAALFETLRNFYGTDDIRFTFTSDEYSGTIRGSDGVIRPRVPRTFDSLSEAEFENAQSRIYLGVHWGFDRDAGMTQGQGVADYLFDNYFQPRRSGGGGGGSRPRQGQGTGVSGVDPTLGQWVAPVTSRSQSSAWRAEGAAQRAAGAAVVITPSAEKPEVTWVRSGRSGATTSTASFVLPAAGFGTLVVE